MVTQDKVTRQVARAKGGGEMIDRSRGYIDVGIVDPCCSLAEWKILIDKLIAAYGEETLLFTDAGYDNIEFYLQAPDIQKKGK
jgi:hypothetical protein